ncbi:fimbrial usher protein StbD [Vibrio sp. TH_r3]|uniref:fimbrial usher protein StbD n=1 Tax=Vibrio sp. TH_r3 TaxID=3082084 RepID=UPI002953798A|nr:fimbrial usher protein StbD [Vibrio sp. TH_r3]MDV7104489.1 fimbrial usher protein StbD [Vibrio sp. TH_r3]
MKVIIKLMTVMCLFFSSLAVSTCLRLDANNNYLLSAEAITAGYYTMDNVNGASDGNYGQLGLPAVININSGSAFQPDGTVLASSTASFLTSSNGSAYGEKQVLFRCDIEDKNELYEYYSTNADDRYAGMHEVSELPGVSGAYYTEYKYAATRFTNLTTQEIYSRKWKARQLDPSKMFSDERYIYVHAGMFSDVFVEVIKISGVNFNANSNSRFTPSRSGQKVYIAFKGGGHSSGLTVGCDHLTCHNGYYAEWPGGWGWRGQVTFIRGAYCEVTDYTPHILFATVSDEYLNSGETVTSDFSVDLTCESDAISGTTANDSTDSSTKARPVSMGFLVNSSNAIIQAQTLGLISTGGGLTYLLSNHYGEQGIAKGVGIRLYDSNNRALQLLPSLTTETGNSGGWYGYQELTQLASTEVDHKIYRGNFSASLEKLPGETATAGSVYGQVQIIVSFQ